ncbi:MAG: hypothetical protein JW724_06430 [Candidatus Altiarchaeota archaeon]|nr:hypothetical protein [Candidatus Altiarchaeota archaeon]
MDCSFCGGGIPRGTDTIYVTKRGKALYFCSSKCEKNMLKLKRKPRKTRWAEDYRAEKAIRIRSRPVQEEPEKKSPEEKKTGDAQDVKEKKVATGEKKAEKSAKQKKPAARPKEKKAEKAEK